MNNVRKVVWVFLLVTVVIILLFVFKMRPTKLDTLQAQAPQTNEPAVVIAVPTVRQTPQPPPPVAMTPQQAAAGRLAKGDQMAIAALDRNFIIDFWGKVIDQNGVPISGAQVRANSRTYAVATNGQAITEYPQVKVLTGETGVFEIHGMRGDVLTIEAIDMENYETDAGTLKGFSFDPSQGSPSTPEKPVEFKLWQKGLTQQLISADKIFKFIPDGRRYAVDLVAGTINEGSGREGDLQFSVKRPDNASRHQAYDWSLNITPERGGILQEQSAEYYDMTLAPQTGYTNVYKSDHNSSDSQWEGGENHDRFFVKLRDGMLYGRILISVDSFYDPDSGQGRLEIQYTLNQLGSPILR